jgi:RNA polymerase sigma-70 factor (ECF subfamily)
MFWYLAAGKDQVAKMNVHAGDDAELVSRLATGDEAAFEKIFRRHNAAMVRLCELIVRNHSSAEEVVQEAWLAVLKGIGGFEVRSRLASWIFTIAINKARIRARRDGRTISFEDGGPDSSLADAFDGRGRWKDIPELWETITPERILEGRSVMDHVQVAIAQLPPGQRAVLILRGQQSLPAAEVAGILGLTEGNVRLLLHRARLSVRAPLD